MSILAGVFIWLPVLFRLDLFRNSPSDSMVGFSLAGQIKPLILLVVMVSLPGRQ